MERSLAGVLFLVAAVAISIAAGAWWLQRVVFTPDATRQTAAAMLQELDLRQDIITVVVGASVPYTSSEDPIKTAEYMSGVLEHQVLTTRPGAAVMGPILEQAHQRVIGNRDEQVRITGPQMVEIVRDQRVAEAQPVLLPVPQVGTLATTRAALSWIMPISAVIGVIVLLLGIVTRPERRDILRGLGELCLSLAVSLAVFGYLIPVHMITAIDNNTWAHIAPRLALRTAPVVAGIAVGFAVAGAALLLSARSGGGRRQWSTPLAVGRYQSGGSNPGWG